MSKSRRLVRLTLGAVAGLALLPGAANAGLLAVDAESCASQSLGQVFLPWADVATYTLAPGGATVVPGNEPWNVGGASDSSSLSLPAGSSATTGALCVGLGHPTLRLFTRSAGTGLMSSLGVEVLFQGILGLRTLTIGQVLPGSSWRPTPPYLVVANLLPLLPPNVTPVAFRFTPQGPGTWSVDDIYVDPYRTR
jgi:hypothetical protein